MQIKNIRLATAEDQPDIWEIFKHAIELRRQQGSTQWQDGYPNPATIANDIKKQQGFVFLAQNGSILAYAAIIKNNEPAYDVIEGAWLTDGDFMVVHRVAVSKHVLGKGLAKEIFEKIEDYVRAQNIASIKVDTNYDNIAMLKTLDKLGYQYCGEVYFRESPRKAFEKILS